MTSNVGSTILDPDSSLMIARTWRGATTAKDAESYLQYLHRTGFPAFRDTPGNLGALGLRRIVGDKAEFLIMSLWESEEAIRAFAGEDIDRAVFYPEDDRFLVDRDDHVTHFEVIYDAVSRTRDAGSALLDGHPVSSRIA